MAGSVGSVEPLAEVDHLASPGTKRARRKVALVSDLNHLVTFRTLKTRHETLTNQSDLPAALGVDVSPVFLDDFDSLFEEPLDSDEPPPDLPSDLLSDFGLSASAAFL